MDSLSQALPPEADALLAELEQLESWESAAATDDLRAVIADRRSQVSARLARAMLAWKRGGGSSEGAGAPVGSVPPATVNAAARALTRIPSASGAPSTVVVRARGGEPRVEAWRAEPRPPVTGYRTEAWRAEPRTAASFGYDRFGSTRPRASAVMGPDVDGGWALPPVDSNWPRFVSALLRDIGTSTSAAAELDAIVHAIEGWERWRGMPSDVQRAMAAWLAARLHVIQERGFAEDARVSHGFSLLSAFMKRARPGFVHGLARGHRPLRGTWDEDADVLVAGLEELLPPDAEPSAEQKRRIAALAELVKDALQGSDGVREAAATQLRRDLTALLQSGLSHREPSLVEGLQGTLDLLDGPELRPLRRWFRALTARAREFDADTERPPEDWAHWEMVRDRKGLLVGGTPRELVRGRLQSLFGFQSLAWVQGEARRGAAPEAHRAVTSGDAELVIFLRAAAGGAEIEEELAPLCDERGTTWISVDHGWSAGRIRQAIERHHAMAASPEDVPSADDAEE